MRVRMVELKNGRLAIEVYHAIHTTFETWAKHSHYVWKRVNSRFEFSEWASYDKSEEEFLKETIRSRAVEKVLSESEIDDFEPVFAQHPYKRERPVEGAIPGTMVVDL